MHLAGHLGMALLFTAIFAFVFERRVGVAFTALALTTAMLPDIDLLLSNYFPIHHHGVTHTLLFVGIASAILGTVLAAILRANEDVVEQVTSENRRLSYRTLWYFCTAAFFLGAFSHLFADILSASDIAPPLEPLWPIYGAELITADVIPVNSDLWNFGLLLVGLVVNIGFTWAFGDQGKTVLEESARTQ
jgi:inner membrane protein